jgi:transcriptional regulator GlxA family with amidase domain
LKRGADEYLTKPFDAEELLLIISNQLDHMKHYRSFFSKQLVMKGDIEKVDSMDDQFMQKVFSIVEAQIENSDFTVEEFAKQAGMSHTQLYRKVMALTGQTPNEFIRSLRLKKAAQLILQQFGNVSDVAYAVGFNNLSYFAKCFKKQFGVSPNEYGREQQIKT